MNYGQQERYLIICFFLCQFFGFRKIDDLVESFVGRLNSFETEFQVLNRKARLLILVDQVWQIRARLDQSSNFWDQILQRLDQLNRHSLEELFQKLQLILFWLLADILSFVHEMFVMKVLVGSEQILDLFVQSWIYLSDGVFHTNDDKGNNFDSFGNTCLEKGALMPGPTMSILSLEAATILKNVGPKFFIKTFFMKTRNTKS